MTSADSAADAELILYRPGHRAAGAARRIHVFLDEEQVADLELCGTTTVATTSGPHLLRARCLPLISGSFPVILNAGESLRVLIYVGALDELTIQLDEQPDRSSPTA
jgi:hypothetical protein